MISWPHAALADKPKTCSATIHVVFGHILFGKLTALHIVLNMTSSTSDGNVLGYVKFAVILPLQIIGCTIVSDLYLIAHKVRGEAAFDVACQMACPVCCRDERDEMKSFDDSCVECDGLGYWWIIPTSGHRAYPWWYFNIHCFVLDNNESLIMDKCPSMPEGLPDHYPTRAAQPRPDLTALFRSAHVSHIRRR